MTIPDAVREAPDQTARLRQSVEKMLTSLRAPVIEMSHLAWKPSDGFLPLVMRAVLVKQYEHLSATCRLVDADMGYASAPLLRSACEELIWLTYLGRLPVEQAESLIVQMGHVDLSQTLVAQANEAGEVATEALGLTRHVALARAHTPKRNNLLAELGRQLGWPKKSVAKGHVPSVAFIAGEVGLKHTYDFLYHATSRFVHFSVPELLRRAWGPTGQVNVSSAHFGNYWSHFSLFWGATLLMDTTILFCDYEPTFPMPDEDALLASASEIGAFGKVPIVTAEELAWPTDGATSR